MKEENAKIASLAAKVGNFFPLIQTTPIFVMGWRALMNESIRLTRPGFFALSDSDICNFTIEPRREEILSERYLLPLPSTTDAAF
jgi:hypothetical protein